MDTPTTLGLAGGALTRPMVPDSDSILPWTAARYELRWRRGGLHFTGSATQYLYHPNSVEGFRWQAQAFGPGGARSEPSWHESAEAARAAVEEHIAAHIEARLSEVAR